MIATTWDAPAALTLIEKMREHRGDFTSVEVKRGFVLTSEQLEELERRDAQLVSGAVEPVRVNVLMRQARARIQ